MTLVHSVLSTLLVALLCRGIPTASKTGNLGDADEMTALHLPSEAYKPTAAERSRQVEEYRVKPNRGYIIEDRPTKSVRQPTHDEATKAVKTAVDYHSRNMHVLQKLATANATGEYTKLGITTPENEYVASEWKATGAKRAKKVEAEHAHGPLNLNPEPSNQMRNSVYDPRDPNAEARMPRNEPVNVEQLNGVDKVVEMPAVTHPPPFDDCTTNTVYSEHRERDTVPIMEDSEQIHPSRQGNGTDLDVSQCQIKCDGDNKCLGFVETFANPRDTECWTIPSSKFPDGNVKMHYWNGGSTFIKAPPPPPPPHCVNGATGYTGPRKLPDTDFGPVIQPITELTPSEKQALQAHEAAFMSYEMKGLAEHDDPDQVDLARSHTVVERKEKARDYYNERKEKIIEKHNSALRTKAERAKKAAILEAAATVTATERAQKAKVLERERTEKKAIQEKDIEAKTKEVEFKKTPEGQLQESERIAAIEDVYAKQKEADDMYLSAQDAISAKMREKEAAKEAAAAVNVTKALDVITVYKNESRLAVLAGGNETNIVAGSDVYKAMTYLEDRGVPYLDTYLDED